MVWKIKKRAVGTLVAKRPPQLRYECALLRPVESPEGGSGPSRANGIKASHGKNTLFTGKPEGPR